jgi:hypothetical protein
MYKTYHIYALFDMYGFQLTQKCSKQINHVSQGLSVTYILQG